MLLPGAQARAVRNDAKVSNTQPVTQSSDRVTGTAPLQTASANLKLNYEIKL